MILSLVIQDRDSLAETTAHRTALACVEAGIEAAHPERVVREAIGFDGETVWTIEKIQLPGAGNEEP